MSSEYRIGCMEFVLFMILTPWIASAIAMFVFMEYLQCALYLFGTGILTTVFTYIQEHE